MSTEKNKTVMKIKIVIVDDSIVWNVLSRSLNKFHKEYFIVRKWFPGWATQDIKD